MDNPIEISTKRLSEETIRIHDRNILVPVQEQPQQVPQEFSWAQGRH